MSNEAVFKVTIRGTAEAVWRELTKQDELQGAVFNSWMETRAVKAGEPFRMLTPTRKFVGVVGKILEVDPPRLYVHTMRFTNIDEPEMTVRHEIRPVSGGVEYTMRLSNFVPGSKSGKQAEGGMSIIGNALKAIVETGRPGFMTRMLWWFIGVVERYSPESQRVEHWPLGKL